MRILLRVTFPRLAHARCAQGGKRARRRAGAERAPGVRGRGGGSATGDKRQAGGAAAMYRHVTATVTATVRLRPGRAWAPAAAAAPGPAPPRRRYRARPQDLEPHLGPCPTLALLPQVRPPGTPPRGLEGLGGPVTTVDGRREDDIDVRDPPRLLLGPPGPPPDTPGTPQGRRPNPPSMEEHLARMHEKLQHELPNFFLKIPDYALYAPDVEFQCQHLHLHTRGRAMYAVAVALCRALAWGYFASLRLEVLALTRHPEDWSVRARWRLTGLPLHLLLLRWYRRDKRSLLRSYDAFSTFFLNSQGLVRCHRVDKLMPAPTAVPEPKKLLVAAALAVALTRP
ncbi:LOW QUALITY PROTEIN: uncharacterized protein C6orf136 homolog [Cinclus cinclus]|uniref:LOW QUALITY PROTEIN: uncharacterized protein C6orf136 homolog n=1 Tax=Cinclus cinclus TaxID=127875 RepID=UPI002E0DC5BD